MGRNRRLATGGIAALGLLLWSGCLGMTSSLHRDGLAYMDARAYDQAIEKLSLALAEKPGDPGIAADLERARQSAAEEHFGKGVGLSARNEINGALIEFDKARTYQPNNETYAKRYREEQSKYEQIEKEIDGALALAGKNEWDPALRKLDSMLLYESSFPEIGRKIEKVRRSAATHHETRSERNLDGGNYPGAYEEIEKAGRYLEEERLDRKRRARHHLLLSSQAWKERRYLRAYEEILKGLEFEPDHPALRRYEKRLVDQWSDILYNEAVQATNSGRAVVAKDRLTRLTKIRPGYLNAEEMLSELQSSLAAQYFAKADSLLEGEDRSRVGTALANLLLAREQHSGAFPDLEERIVRAKTLLRREVEFRISIDFRNESQEPGVAGFVRDRVLASLRNAGELTNVNILDRESIDDILREQGLGQGFLDETTNLPVKRIKGIQAAVKGEIIKVGVVESGRNRPTYGSVKYVSGTRPVPNPDYQKAQQDVAFAQQDILTSQQESNRAELEHRRIAAQNMPYAGQGGTVGALGALTTLTSSIAVTGAKNNLQKAQKALTDAQNRLGGTPPQIEEDVYSDFRYEIFDLSMEGEVVLSFKVINFATSEIGPVRTIRKTETLTDRYVPGDPGKGIRSDPNELPDREEMKNRLLAKAIAETVDAVRAELSKYSSGYYEKGMAAENDRIEEEAVENYMRFIYSAPDLSDPRVQHANEYIYEAMGLRVVRKKE